jgi:prophage maintenance system killer protein
MEVKVIKNEIVLFENQDVKLEVNMKDETVWLSQQQMALLFNSSRTNIIEHINNIYSEEELDKVSTCQNFRQVQKEGKRNIARNIPFYNLDMIISVGYRVKSKNGIVFRKWANKIIKDYLIKGYAVNNKRLEYLEKTIKLLDIAGRIDGELSANEAQSIIKVINKYSNALNLLDKYDYKKVSKPKGTKNNKKITYEECINIINTLRFNNYSDLFALERNNGLKGIIDDIYSTFDGSDLYSTVEEKAANMLYLVTKNHVFIDGNKRIAATLFIYFLNYYGLLYNEKGMVIDNNTLVAVTILIAQSDPKEKEVLVDLVMNFLKGE